MTTTNSRHDHIRGRFASNRQWLNDVLKRVTPELLAWSPREGMRTVAGQIAEILSVEISLMPQMRDGRSVSNEEADAMIGDLGSLDNLRNMLDSTRRTTLEYLDSLSPQELEAETSYGDIWFGSYWRDTMPRAEIFVNVAEHEFYHVGQLIAYLWSRGDDPYTW